MASRSREVPHALMTVDATHTVEYWEEYQALLLTPEAAEKFGPRYCSAQVEYAEAQIQSLLPQKISSIAA